MPQETKPFGTPSRPIRELFDEFYELVYGKTSPPEHFKDHTFQIFLAGFERAYKDLTTTVFEEGLAHSDNEDTQDDFSLAYLEARANEIKNHMLDIIKAKLGKLREDLN